MLWLLWLLILIIIVVAMFITKMDEKELFFEPIKYHEIHKLTRKKH